MKPPLRHACSARDGLAQMVPAILNAAMPHLRRCRWAAQENAGHASKTGINTAAGWLALSLPTFAPASQAHAFVSGRRRSTRRLFRAASTLSMSNQSEPV